jgi:hypothetical protein
MKTPTTAVRAHALESVAEVSDFASLLYRFEPSRAEISARLRKAASFAGWFGFDASLSDAYLNGRT